MTQYSVLSTQHSPSARSPLHHWHAAHGARFTETGGWQVAAVYTTVEQEVAVAQAGVGLADISAFTKIIVRGSGAANVGHALIGNGQSLSTLGVAAFDADAPALVCRLTTDSLLLLGSTPSRDALEKRLDSSKHTDAVVWRDATSAYAGFHLVGTHTEQVLRRVIALDGSPDAFPMSSCAETSFAGVHVLLVRAPDFAVPSMRIYVPWDLGEFVWESLLAAGRGCKIVPVGLDAWQRL